MKDCIAYFALAMLLISCVKGNEEAYVRRDLIQQLKNSHSNEEWFVPIFPALNDVSAEQASWRDSSENHSIGQLVSHLAFWNERVLKSFQGATVPDFKGNNEITFKFLNEKEWAASKNRLDSIQRLMVQVVEDASSEQLKEWNITINNLCMHNAYHTGQIIYIRKKQGWWKTK